MRLQASLTVPKVKGTPPEGQEPQKKIHWLEMGLEIPFRALRLMVAVKFPTLSSDLYSNYMCS
jgi:hypothetical protein